MTTIEFWLIAGTMTVFCVVLFVYPVLKKVKDEQTEAISRDSLNKAFYHDRMMELSEEAEGGLVDDKNELATELKHSLLDDIPQQQTVTQKPVVSSLMLLPGVIIFVGIVVGTYFIVGSNIQVQRWQQTAQQLPELSARMMADADEPMTDQEMKDMTLALRTQLQKTPSDGMGWLLLGRIALANRDAQTAEGAMTKAFSLLPEDTDVQLGYAQALMLTGDEINTQTAKQLLTRLIKKDHGNLQALSLLAFEAFERGAYDEAKAAWLTMKQLLPPTDSRVGMLERSIARADAQLNVGQGQTVSTTVALAPNVTLPDQGVLFVSVHSADGAPMPIAAKRLPLNAFPLEVVLSDSDSMIPERPMSSLTDVILKARIDIDGNVMTKETNLVGESPVIKLGEKTQILITQ